MKPPLMFAAVCLCAGMLPFVPPDALAEFYTYKDNGGNMVINNRLEDVPQKYRQRVKVVWDKDLESKDPLARRNAEAEKIAEQRGLRQDQRKTVEKKKTSDDKTLVIILDEETGQLIRRLE